MRQRIIIRPSMALSPGSQLGAYRIVGALGAGGMGEVYRAHDPRLARDVALKVLPAEMAGDPARLERFTIEARAIAALNHPHIITIYSTEDAEGVRFLTMELVEGQSLDALIPPTGLPITRFLELALPLADALTAAHQKQITHRDLKPANVMVAANGRVKVLDFGLARVSGPLPSHQTIEATRLVLTSEGTIVGTMPYMSPEQIEGRLIDHRTDLFSLGVMFHEMLTGARPFEGESSPQLMSSILRDTPSSASDIRTDVPDALSRLIHRCLEKRPDDRVQTARDIYNELRHVQKQLESGSARRPSDSGSARVAAAESAWIAVLPFTTRTADPDSQALASGLTEDITSGLSLFPSLSVVALHSTRSFKDSPLDARQIAERLNARYIMGGSVRKSASGLRIAVHLIDAHNTTQLWGDTYDHGGGERRHLRSAGRCDRSRRVDCGRQGGRAGAVDGAGDPGSPRRPPEREPAGASLLGIRGATDACRTRRAARGPRSFRRTDSAERRTVGRACQPLSGGALSAL